MKHIGIDVAKRSFVAAFPKSEGFTTSTYRNDANRITLFLSEFDRSLHHYCVLEATDNYGALLVEMLVSAEVAVSVTNPRQIKHFGKAMHHITKTDKVDAQLIALYGAKMEPKSYKMPVSSIQALKQQKTLLSQLKKQLTMSYNLLESLSVLPKRDAVTLKVII